MEDRTPIGRPPIGGCAIAESPPTVTGALAFAGGEGRFAGSGDPPASAFPGLLRLQAAGIPVAVLRRGDDLAARLGAAAVRKAANV